MVNHMEYKRYFKYCLPDFLLVLLMTTGFTINVYQGFYLPETLSSDVLRLVIIAGVVTAALLAASYSLKTVKIAVPAAVILAVIAVFFAYAKEISLTEGDDPQLNAGLWYLLTILCTLAVFLLARAPQGSLALLAGGVFLISVLAVLGYECRAWGYILFLFAGSVNFIYKRYRRNVFRTSTAKDAFPPLLAAAALVTAVSLLIGTFLCFTVVKALDPPVKDLKLITKIVSVEVLDRLGISQKESLMDLNNTSQDINENMDQVSSEVGDQDEKLEKEAENQSSDGPETDDNSRSESDLTVNPDESVFARAVSYAMPKLSPVMKIVLAILLLAAAAAVIFIIVNRRKYFLKRISKLSKEEQIVYLYSWYRKKFKHLNIARPEGDTPYEYAARIELKTRHLNAGDITWMDLTDDFVRIYYGGQEISDEDYEKWLKYYGEFHRNCRRMLGGKYLLKYFVL